jgi:hypothetical protein
VETFRARRRQGVATRLSAVPGLPLQTEAFVLLKRAPTDAFQGFAAFSGEHGALQLQQRISKKPTSASPPLDLFDEVALRLESPNQGQSWFVQEARIITRHADLGRSYDTLRHASALASLVARNSVHEESRAQVAILLRQAFASFAAGARPDLVWLKSLYLFARDEGYPVKQEWLPRLTATVRAQMIHVLKTPVADLREPTPAQSSILIQQLEDYLKGQTEIIVK